MTYELMDLETANVVGIYSTENAAFAAVLEIQSTGEDSDVDCLGLGYIDSGKKQSHEIARGRVLLQRAREASS